jgi:hypothetical protein
MFNEICIYEAKIEKQDEIEVLMKEVAAFYLSQPGVADVKYIKRTHRKNCERKLNTSFDASQKSRIDNCNTKCK